MVDPALKGRMVPTIPIPILLAVIPFACTGIGFSAGWYRPHNPFKPANYASSWRGTLA